MTTIDVGAVTASGRRMDGLVSTRWTDGFVQGIGPEPGPDAHVVYWSSVEDQP